MKSEYEEQVISGQRCEAIKIFYNGVNYKSKLEGKWTPGIKNNFHLSVCQ